MLYRSFDGVCSICTCRPHVPSWHQGMSVPTTTELKGIMKWLGSNIFSLETVLGQFYKCGSPMMYCNFWGHSRHDLWAMWKYISPPKRAGQMHPCCYITDCSEAAPVIILGLWMPLWGLHGQFFPMNIINTAWGNCCINYHHHSGTVADQKCCMKAFWQGHECGRYKCSASQGVPVLLRRRNTSCKLIS